VCRCNQARKETQKVFTSRTISTSFLILPISSKNRHRSWDCVMLRTRRWVWQILETPEFTRWSDVVTVECHVGLQATQTIVCKTALRYQLCVNTRATMVFVLRGPNMYFFPTTKPSSSVLELVRDTRAPRHFARIPHVNYFFAKLHILTRLTRQRAKKFCSLRHTFLFDIFFTCIFFCGRVSRVANVSSRANAFTRATPQNKQRERERRKGGIGQL
jgi:hypothetical protein